MRGASTDGCAASVSYAATTSAVWLPHEQLGQVALAASVTAQVERDARAAQLVSRRRSPLEVAALAAAEAVHEQGPQHRMRELPRRARSVGVEAAPTGAQRQPPFIAAETEERQRSRPTEPAPTTFGHRPLPDHVIDQGGCEHDPDDQEADRSGNADQDWHHAGDRPRQLEVRLEPGERPPSACFRGRRGRTMLSNARWAIAPAKLRTAARRDASSRAAGEGGSDSSERRQGRARRRS